jgi:hypothetical protein
MTSVFSNTPERTQNIAQFQDHTLKDVRNSPADKFP